MARSAQVEGQRRPPSIAALAAQAGVSYVTMWNAVCELRQSGAWQQARPAIDDESMPWRRCKWERVRGAIERDMVDGVLAPESLLPSVKELASRYGACAHTVRKATNALVYDGRLEPATRGLMVRSFAHRHGAHRVVLIARGHSYGDLAENAPQRGCLRILEAECSRRGLTLQTEFVYYRAEGVPRLTRSIAAIESESDRHGQTLGYIIWEQAMGEQTLGILCRELRPTGKPVAVWLGEGSRVGRRAPSAMFGFFATTTYEGIGVHVGRYLLELGHRTIAFVSSRSDDEPSRSMLGGLKTASRTSGVGGGVLPLFCEVDSDVASDATHEQTRQFIEGHLFPFGNPTRATPRRRHRMMNQRMRVMRQVDKALRVQVLQKALTPRLRQALSDTSITAWVAANDNVGVECVNFLADAKADVARRLSVVGVGNTEEALLHNMTSYSLNYPALMSAMLSHVLHPYTRAGRDSRCHRVAGFVVPRGSTARACAADTSERPHASI